MSIEKAQAARATAHLDRVLSHNGILKTARAMVIELVNQGRTAKVKTYNWKDKERTAYVLEDEAEGIFVELTKTQYLYALELIAQREAEPRPAPEEVKPGHDIGEDMTAWPVIVATLREALSLLRGGVSVPQVKNFVSVKLNPDNQEGPLTTWDINMLKTLAHVSPNNFKTRLQYARRLSVELKDAEGQLAKMQAKKDQEAAQGKANTPRPFDRSERLDAERFDLVVYRGNGNPVTMNSVPLTHREGITMLSKQSDATRPFARLVSRAYGR